MIYLSRIWLVRRLDCLGHVTSLRMATPTAEEAVECAICCFGKKEDTVRVWAEPDGEVNVMIQTGYIRGGTHARAKSSPKRNSAKRRKGKQR